MAADSVPCVVDESGGRRFAGTDPDALASQLIWHVVGPDPAKSEWRAAAADWAGITGPPSVKAI